VFFHAIIALLQLIKIIYFYQGKTFLRPMPFCSEISRRFINDRVLTNNLKYVTIGKSG